MKFVFGIFLLFGLIVGTTTWISRSRYQAGQGLHQSVNAAVLLQVQAAANADLHIDLQPKTPAQRVEFGKVETILLEIKNLSPQNNKFKLHLEFDPSASAAAFAWQADPVASRALQPNESTEVSIPFVLNQIQGLTADGTLTLKFSLQPAL